MNKQWISTRTDWNNRYGHGPSINIVTLIVDGTIQVELYNPITKKGCVIQRGSITCAPLFE